MSMFTRYILEVTDKTGTREILLSMNEWFRFSQNLAIPEFHVRQEDGSMVSYRLYKEEPKKDLTSLSWDELLKLGPDLKEMVPEPENRPATTIPSENKPVTPLWFKP